IESGFYSCKLGNRVLRTETAALAAASFAQTLWGDFR
ncbi:MAG TPA: 16S rRNA (uracil(1498)-N(3))-methyltransferase, partial [Sutterellaceae bacterium]|nr:16S rRNA (uracil(1498)-N(3))-methyltransferase [Sutterellaceae bacterium]